MSETLGRAWIFADDINTDALAPGRYMHRPFDELAQNCLIDISADFAANAAAGDILIAGHNFGVGSSREQAALALKTRGIVAVVAQSFAGIFYRNAINLGLPVLVGEAGHLADGSKVALDIDKASLTHEQGIIQLQPIPAFLLSIIRDGGLVPHLQKRFANKEKNP